MAHSPLPNLGDSWSPRWRSLHPILTDGEVLDALKAELERRFAVQGGPHAIARLEINRLLGPHLRLPNGETLHWSQSTKTASTSIMTAICTHMPDLWRGARKSWRLPDGQQSAPAQDIFEGGPLFPALFIAPQTSRRRIVWRKWGLAHAPANIAADWNIIRCNPDVPRQTPPGVWMIPWNKFRRRPYARIRFCVVREPMERFVSAVAFLFEHSCTTNALGDANLQDYFEQTLTRLENEEPPQRKNEDPLHDEHFRHQTWFIGHDPTYYTHIFRMGELERLETCLSEWVGKSVQLPHSNASRDKEKISLTPALRRRVEAWYAEDYKFWGKYF